VYTTLLGAPLGILHYLTLFLALRLLNKVVIHFFLENKLLTTIKPYRVWWTGREASTRGICVHPISWRVVDGHNIL
jgi:hypothetical protein